MGHIYKITNTATNLVYVGKTVHDINKRFDEHISSGRKINGSSQISKSLREYGSLNHTIEVLEDCENNLLLEREQYWIDKLNTLHIGLNIKNEKLQKEHQFWGFPERAKQNIYNNEIWNKGISPPKEVRKKISETKRKKQQLGLYTNYGHVHTEETKNRLSEIAKNRAPISDTTKKKLREQSSDRKFYHSMLDKKRISIKSNDDIPCGYVEGKGTVWVTKDGKNISIDVWDLNEYINYGYEKGRYVVRKNR